MKNPLKNKIVQLGLAAVLGGVLTMLFLQETIIKKREEVSKARQEELQKKLSLSEEKLRVAKTELSRNRKKVIIRTTKPDGSTTEIITVESNETVISEIREDERRKLSEEFSVKMAELEKKVLQLSVHKNPKRFSILGGGDPKGYFGERVYYFGITYKFWGPLTVGGVVNTKGLIVPMIGVQF